MLSIPVKLHTPNAIVTETEGLLRLGEGRLVLEYETKDTFLGAYRSGVDELEMLPDDVASVGFRTGLFKTELIVRARSMKTFEHVPGSRLGEVTLRVKRKHRADAQMLAAFLQDRLAALESAGEDSPIQLPRTDEWGEHDEAGAPTPDLMK